MAATTTLTAPTQFAEAGGIRFAYRRFGAGPGRPLLLFPFFRGNLDSYDPRVCDGLAAGRELILFDNTGVGLSTGTAPDTIAGMARDAELFADTLGLTEVDIFAHSMGGYVAQQVTLDRPELVRRLVLAGTGPRGGEGMAQRKPEVAELFAAQPDPQDLMWLPIMFSPSAASQAAGWQYLDRTRARTQDRDLPVSAETTAAHSRAARGWGGWADGYDYLEKITQPALVVNGSNDIVVPTVNSYLLQQHLPSAQLVLYPDSNHGSQFQYPDLFVWHAAEFLDR